MPRALRLPLATIATALAGLAIAVGAGGSRSTPTGVNQAAILADGPAPSLQDYGFFLDAGADRPAPDVMSYDINTPLFSDYAVKHRYLYLPPGAKFGYRAHGVLDLPVGAALIKTFDFPADLRTPGQNARRIETRVLLRKERGWTAQAYVWNADRTRAVLKIAGAHMNVAFIDSSGRPRAIGYAVPNVNQCKECHAVNGALSPIGPKARNLNVDHDFDGIHENQLARLVRLGRLIGAPEPSLWPRTAVWTDPNETLEARARAYLDANCGHCHSRASFADNSGLYLDLDEDLDMTPGVGKRPVAAGRGSGGLAFDIAPGDPDHSILVYRMASDDPGVMMPQLGRSTVDGEGLALIRAYVTSMKPTRRPN